MEDSSLGSGCCGLVVDVGANIGFFTIVAAALFPQAKFVSFEPQPSTYANLVRNIVQHNLTHRVKPHAFGLGFQDYMARAVYTDLNSGGSSTYSLNGGWGGKPDGEDVKNLKTHVQVSLRDPIKVLGHVVATHGDIDYLKLDCEGCEYEIFAALPWHRIRRIGFGRHSKHNVLPGAKRLSDEAVARYNASAAVIEALVESSESALRTQFMTMDDGPTENGFYRVTSEVIDVVDAARRRYGLPPLTESYG